MLARLGIRKLAYDWRERDIPTFDAEIDALGRHGIELTAFWIPSGLEPQKEKHVGIILDLLERRGLKTQIWVNLTGAALKAIEPLPQADKVAAAARAFRYLAGRAAKIGCSVALYNHGGWFGEPENQIEIIRHLKLDNVGIVYNFHHGREHMDRFAELFAMMKPYLLAINLNGMRKDGPMILPLGQGDRELEMLRIIQRSGYRGPVGILDHRSELDAEESLRQNLEGLKKLLAELGDEEALRTY